jgi:hypothetical protein
MSWFIVNLVVSFATGEGQLLVFPKGAETKKGVKYVLSLKNSAEVAYWSNRFIEAKTAGANGLMVKVAFELSKGYPNKTAFVKNGVTIGVGEEVTHFLRLTEGIKASNVTNYVKGQGRVSALPTDDGDTISSIPS